MKWNHDVYILQRHCRSGHVYICVHTSVIHFPSRSAFSIHIDSPIETPALIKGKNSVFVAQPKIKADFVVSDQQNDVEIRWGYLHISYLHEGDKKNTTFPRKVLVLPERTVSFMGRKHNSVGLEELILSNYFQHVFATHQTITCGIKGEKCLCWITFEMLLMFWQTLWSCRQRFQWLLDNRIGSIVIGDLYIFQPQRKSVFSTFRKCLIITWDKHKTKLRKEKKKKKKKG